VQAIITDSDLPVDYSFHNTISEFVTSFLNSQTKPSAPSALWDLHVNHHKYLHLSPPIAAFQPLKARVGMESTDQTLYSIHPPGSYCNVSDLMKHTGNDSDKMPWLLALEDTATVIQCLRLKWGPSKRAIAHNLVENGIPFLTLTPVPNRPVVPERMPLIASLGYRSKGYHPSPVDYVIYEEARDIFLSHCLVHTAIL
jgi:hypothetical protein